MHRGPGDSQLDMQPDLYSVFHCYILMSTLYFCFLLVDMIKDLVISFSNELLQVSPMEIQNCAELDNDIMVLYRPVSDESKTLCLDDLAESERGF